MRRWLEIALLVSGVSLLGVAFKDRYVRWNYQTQQTRALERREPAISVVRTIAPVSVTVAPRRIEKKRRAPAADPTALGRIEIPRLGIAAIVKDGVDEATLARAVGRLPGSARPGEIGNMVLAGHRDTFFEPLSEIKVNDRIRMVVPPHVYEYRVKTLRVVTPEETGVLASNGVEELTLVTCYPFSMIGPAPDRFIVSAARIVPRPSRGR